jgi:hypothetical protein
MSRNAWLCACVLLAGGVAAVSGQDAGAAASAVLDARLVHLPGTTTTVELPAGWILANPVDGAQVVLEGPPEHAMPLGEALASRPMIAISITALAATDTALGLAQQARRQCERLLSHFTVLSGNESVRTFTGRDWQYLHYTFELAQQSCNQELYVSTSPGIALYVVCSCAPSRAGSYQEVFGRTLASMGGGSGTPLLAQPLPAAR